MDKTKVTHKKSTLEDNEDYVHHKQQHHRQHHRHQQQQHQQSSSSSQDWICSTVRIELGHSFKFFKVVNYIFLFVYKWVFNKVIYL